MFISDLWIYDSMFDNNLDATQLSVFDLRRDPLGWIINPKLHEFVSYHFCSRTGKLRAIVSVTNPWLFLFTQQSKINECIIDGHCRYHQKNKGMNQHSESALRACQHWNIYANKTLRCLVISQNQRKVEPHVEVHTVEISTLQQVFIVANSMMITESGDDDHRNHLFLSRFSSRNVLSVNPSHRKESSEPQEYCSKTK